MFGNEDPVFFHNRYHKVYGPIPVPNACSVTSCSQNDPEINDLDALAIIFNVKYDLPSDDSRVEKYGKDIIAWLLFKTVDRKDVFKKIEIIEEIAYLYLKDIKNVSELDDKPYFLNFYEDLKNSLTCETINEPSGF